MEKFYWEDFFSDLVADLLLGQDVEELAKVLGKAPNTVSCFAYKSKVQNLPNVKQLGEILEFVNRTRPEAVASALKKFCARFGVVAGSRGEVLRLADMCKAVTESAKYNPQAVWEEKLTDAHNYLFLLEALVKERYGWKGPEGGNDVRRSAG